MSKIKTVSCRCPPQKPYSQIMWFEPDDCSRVAITPTQRDADKRQFMNRINDEAGRADFERYGWVSSYDVQAVYDFWEELFPDIFEGLEN